MCNVELGPFFFTFLFQQQVNQICFTSLRCIRAKEEAQRVADASRMNAFQRLATFGSSCRHVDLGPSRKSAYFSGQICHCAGKPGEARNMPLIWFMVAHTSNQSLTAQESMNERLIQSEEEQLKAMQAKVGNLRNWIWLGLLSWILKIFKWYFFQVEAQMEASEIKDECSTLASAHSVRGC